MKVIFNDKEIGPAIEKYASEIGAEFQQKDSLEVSMKDYKGPPIGIPIPEEFLDLGKYLLTFFLGAIASGLVYDVIKKAIKSLIIEAKDKTRKEYKFYIISDGDDPDKYGQNTYFFIPVDAELESTIDGLFEILTMLEYFRKSVQVEGSLRFYFEGDEWILRHLINPKYSYYF